MIPNCIYSIMTLEHSDRALVASPKFRRNFSSLVVDSHSAWNKNWGKNLLVGKKKFINTYEVKTPVFDPISVTKYKNLWHRGFPLNLLDQRNAKLVGKKNFQNLCTALA